MGRKKEGHAKYDMNCKDVLKPKDAACKTGWGDVVFDGIKGKKNLQPKKNTAATRYDYFFALYSVFLIMERKRCRPTGRQERLSSLRREKKNTGREVVFAILN